MFELQVEDCFLHGDSSRLVSVIHQEGLSVSTLNRLNHLVNKELCDSGFSRVLVLMKSLTIMMNNKDIIQELISLGLLTKVMLWFEAVCNLLTSDLHRGSAPLFTLAEEFFDYFLLLGEDCLPDPQISVVLLQLAHFCLESQIHFPLRLEAIRTFNSFLESLSRDQRRLIQNDEGQTHILSQMAAAVLTVGDYELQVSLSEALCRLTPRRNREQRANQWFPSQDISAAFCKIRDADFEVDCRRFLNFVNHYHGDQRRVYTFPCLRAFLSSTQLFQPKDDKLDKFWIDFNVGSGCVSFFIDDPQGFLWGSIHLLKEEVDHYTLQVHHDETILSVRMTNPIMHHSCRGQTVELTFSYDHREELEEAAARVFNKGPCSSRQPVKGGPVQVSSCQHKPRSQTYSRKKATNKSQLRVLPLSSPSSEEDFSSPKPRATDRAETLFDQIQHSTPKLNKAPVFVYPDVFQMLPLDIADHVNISEANLADLYQPVPVVENGEELQISKDQTVELGNECSPASKMEVLRKREAPDSGYLSDQTEDVSAHKKRAGPPNKKEESKSALTDYSPEGAGLTVEEDVLKDGVWAVGLGRQPVSEQGAEPESQLAFDITAAFKSFRAQLEQHLKGCWQKEETQVFQSMQECQQHVSSLLRAVHQHRLLLMQQFENSVTDQLKQLEDSCSHLNSINTQTLRLFQSEMKQLSSFCEEHLQKLKTLDSGLPGSEPSSS
ncbi:synaptonemal complex protein 2-like isoform X2 [Austrofundulus limnaeus]|uniref:Synaptonemal complex protein 2-like isoform X2 n=1 Tax=Austrofundulus limnaeus TaxID=52670 RepID=A0A2I4DBM5_AUSLI|nr:PREDICTED: synaptonemal complex protein 2-like isoform X2 [Austrofundulus limnaeus]